MEHKESQGLNVMGAGLTILLYAIIAVTAALVFPAERMGYQWLFWPFFALNLLTAVIVFGGKNALCSLIGKPFYFGLITYSVLYLLLFLGGALLFIGQGWWNGYLIFNLVLVFLYLLALVPTISGGMKK